ncbi:MAG: archaetidylserine decarboxylase [Myxococcales bacterium]
MGWFSKIEQPLVRDGSIALWKLFADLELEDAADSEFRSLHDMFTRRLRPGARPIEADPQVLVSPCDGIVGAHGRIEHGQLFQAKGLEYRLGDLLGSEALAARYADGLFVTIRLPSHIYHRFHAPHDCRLQRVTHIAGDTWNTNPIALARVERLFCRNERAVLQTALERGGHQVTLVAVAAILVAGIRLHALDLTHHRGHEGAHALPCDARLRKGEEMGWFEHGSTILVLAPAGFVFDREIAEGRPTRMGRPLMRLPQPTP